MGPELVTRLPRSIGKYDALHCAYQLRHVYLGLNLMKEMCLVAEATEPYTIRDKGQDDVTRELVRDFPLYF